ncbi:STAS domain-containing protein [Streptomyces sp. NPDC048644]|uniref:STAS domain-containing protein n=1 Tax=Streptomyces sp. NPDC048644 TaxID=3365582 RepID=UPI0037170A79
MDEDHNTRGFLGRTYTVGSTTVVELRGELDVLAAWTLSDRLDDFTGTRRPDLILDLRAVTFIDCSGLSLLCRARHRTRAKAGRLRLTGVATGDSVMRLLAMTGLTGSFDVLTDVPSPASGGSDDGTQPGAPDRPAVSAVWCQG